ncbi:MAG: alpha-glucosidase [Lactobacillus porci]|nr:alpha-glucosidase [Lactobacillus porci]
MSKHDEWFKNAIIYQIYPKSFQDSNGDGIGDLNGIRQRIPYLRDLGINAVWLNPIYQSPGVDNGYDVSDYYQIDGKLGSMADFEDMVADLHQAGIKVIMDFVLNHTSIQHPWFKEAVSDPHSPYRDYYIFAGKQGKRPNNWGSFFGGSVWEPDPAGTGQSYFHLFDKRMPDLNWENPKVAQEMLKAAEFWLAKGVDGLRVDAFIHIAKADLRQSYPSTSKEPVVAEPFFANLPEVQERLRPFCAAIRRDFPGTLLLGEAASANVNLAYDYTAKDHGLMDSVVTFRYFAEDQSTVDESYSDQYQPKGMDWLAFKQTQAVWQQTLKDGLPTLYWSNHDMARLGTRFAKTAVQQKSLAMLMYLEHGLPIIYYGEELGLHNLHFEKAADFKDMTVDAFMASAKKAGKSPAAALEMVNATHKLPARGPMPWDDSQFNGFSTVTPWLTGKSQDQVSVKSEEADPDSMLAFYKALLKLKQEALFTDGSYYLLDTAPEIVAYQRDLGQEHALVIVSLSAKKQQVTLPAEFAKPRPVLQAGNWTATGQEVTLMPFAGLVLKAE